MKSIYGQNLVLAICGTLFLIGCNIDTGIRKVPKCNNGEMRCGIGLDENNNIIDVVEKCENEKWEKINDCQPDIQCYSIGNNNAYCAECINGETKCCGNADVESSVCVKKDGFQICRNGQFEYGGDCKNGCFDKNNEAFCGVCTNDDKYCDKNGYMFVCSTTSGIYEKSSSCPDDAQCVELCITDKNGIGQWKNSNCVTEQSCKDRMNLSDDVSCNGENECGECRNGSLRCLADKVQKCYNGKWDTIDDCTANGGSCDSNSNSCIICKEDETAGYHEYEYHDC